MDADLYACLAEIKNLLARIAAALETIASVEYCLKSPPFTIFDSERREEGPAP